MLNFILSLFNKESKIRRWRKRLISHHYILPRKGIWNVFYMLFFFSSFSLSASTVNWEVSNVGNTHDVMAYSLIGDTAFRQQVITSIEDKTFTTLVANNPASSFGNYIVPSPSGYVKSIDFTIDNSIKNVSMFIVVFNQTNPNSYNFADVSDILTKTINKSKMNTFSFDFNSNPPSRIYAVPEADVICLLSLSICIILVLRPRQVYSLRKSLKKPKIILRK